MMPSRRTTKVRSRNSAATSEPFVFTSSDCCDDVSIPISTTPKQRRLLTRRSNSYGSHNDDACSLSPSSSSASPSPSSKNSIPNNKLITRSRKPNTPRSLFNTIRNILLYRRYHYVTVIQICLVVGVFGFYRTVLKNISVLDATTTSQDFMHSQRLPPTYSDPTYEGDYDAYILHQYNSSVGQKFQFDPYYKPTKEQMERYVASIPTIPMKSKHERQCSTIADSLQNISNHHQRCLVHLHIGKNGGTSLDRMMFKLLKSKLPFKSKLQKQLMDQYKYMGNIHFDWSYLLGSSTTFQQSMYVITMLRHPIQRLVSHYYFFYQLQMKSKKKGQRNKVNITVPTIQEFFNIQRNSDETDNDKQVNVERIFASRDVWQDGQAAVSWLSGTHIASWVLVPSDQIEEREKACTQDNIPLLLNLAADRLEHTIWFGILEDIPRSMELLQYTLLSNGNTESDNTTRTVATNIKINPSDQLFAFPQSNKGKVLRPQTQISDEEIKILESLLPLDLWLYEYGKRLFNVRYQAYKDGKSTRLVILPERPPLPPIPLPCWSTRFVMNCTTTSPIQGNYQFLQL